MLRKLAIAIAASGAMMSASTIHALGMGNIELDSALNQPLNARIKLLKASELENWEIKPDLASREEFEKSGVERVFFLNSLKFEVIRDGADVYVDVTSSQPVVEPFLNFLVQVDWPNGRLLREYTLLLDPPVFEEDSMPAEVAAPQEQSFEEQPFQEEVEESLPGVSTGVETQPYVQDEAPEYVEPELEDSPQSIPDDQPSPETSVTPQSTVDVSESVQETYRVEANDTLWEVAVRTRSQRDISPQQAMLAIQDLNPDAFINGNINRLKKNQVLRVPSEEQMRSRSFNEAVAEVAFQNEAFSQRKAQLDATRKDKAMVRTDDNVDGKLTLLASGEASSETDRAASGRVDSQAAGEQSSIENELNLALENLDKSSRENQELRARLDAMEEQINTLQRLINLKDEQMVALQAGMAAPEMDAKLDSAVAADTPKPMEEAEAGEESVKEPAVAPVAVESEVKQDLNFEKPAEQGTKVAQSTGAEVGAKDSSVPSVKPKPKPKFVYEPPVEEPFDVIEFAIENPQIPGAVLGALLLALLGISRARKKKEEQASEQELPEAAAMTGDDPLDHIEGDFEDDFDSEFSDLELGEEGAVDDFDGAQFDEDLAGVDAGLPDSLDETDGHESTDVLGEVDVYLAYNRIEPAKALLEKTIAEQPGRMDLRLKMMEVLAQMDDEDGLNEQFEVIEAQGSDSEKAQAADLKSRLGSGSDDDLSGDLSSDLGLGLDDQGSDDFSGLDLAAGDSELDFDLDGLDLDAPTDASLGLDDGVSGEESGLDFDMDLGSSDELSLDADLDTDSSSDQGLDLDTDLDMSIASELDVDFDAEDSDANSLDFDMDLGGAAQDADDLSLDEGLDITSDDGGLNFDVPELDSNEQSEDLDLDLGDDDLTLSMDSTEDLSSAGDELPDLDADLDLSLDAEELETDFELGDLDSDLDLDASDLDLELGETESLDVPELDESTSVDLDDGLADLDSDLEFGVDLESEEIASSDADVELSLGDELDSVSEMDSDLELPSLEDDVIDALDVPSLQDADVSMAPESEGETSLDLGEDLPSLDGMDELDGDMDFLSGTDESETKLDLARAYIDMDDKDGAKEILQEVLEEGSEEQKQEASKLMDSMV